MCTYYEQKANGYVCMCIMRIGLYFTDSYQNKQQKLFVALVFLLIIENHAKTMREINIQQ